jgi:hypothetical protein
LWAFITILVGNLGKSKRAAVLTLAHLHHFLGQPGDEAKIERKLRGRYERWKSDQEDFERELASLQKSGA